MDQYPNPLFQSTLLMRGATRVAYEDDKQVVISIHAPHARSDAYVGIRMYPIRNFNPRSSCEERPDSPAFTALSIKISIHAPHARSDKHTGYKID